MTICEIFCDPVVFVVVFGSFVLGGRGIRKFEGVIVCRNVVI